MDVFSRSRLSRGPSPPPPPNGSQQEQAQRTGHHAPTSRPLRLLARLTSASPFAGSSSQAMPRSVLDFHIRPDQPFNTYTAGDNVRGTVLLTVVKSLRITHLVVALHGSVCTFRNDAERVKAKAGASTQTPNGTLAMTQYHGRGQASLFQDEQILSGEGRLDPRRYEFQFNLKFPDRALPSSLDFERGRICYTITATLTRPTSIKATTSCDRTITLSENIDVGAISPPRPRIIFLEPISKASKRRKPARPLDGADAASSSDREAADPTTPVRGGEEGNNAMSTRAGSDLAADAQSVRSGRSLQSSISTGPGSSRSTHTQRFPTQLSLSDAGVSSLGGKTITAAVELLKGGCLPGDTVPVKITVQHTKAIKSLHGIVVTLYRDAQINPSPSAAMFDDATTSLNGAFRRPRSRTALARSSSASSAASSKARCFRKDLSQAVGPLMIDPVTLQTSTTMHLRVPEDSFPTIASVPGDMISFRYGVEVIVDLGGRLAGQFSTGGQQSSRVNTFVNSSQAGDAKVFNSWGNNAPIVTTRMRRESGVVAVNMEVVVGTVNSARHQLLKDQKRPAVEEVQQQQTTSPHSIQGQGSRASESCSTPGTPPPLAGSPAQRYTPATEPARPTDDAPAYFPPPQPPDESALSEKEQIQLAEQRLLPSQPPTFAAPSASEYHPSAPPAHVIDPPDGSLFSSARAQLFAPPPAWSASAAGPSAPPRPPQLDESGNPTDDKQELQLRRLLLEASAPPEMPEDLAPVPRGEDFEPSAPMLTEHHFGGDFSVGPVSASDGQGSGSGSGGGGGGHGAEPLPRYERYDGWG